MKEYTCPVCNIVFCKTVYKHCQAVYCSKKCAYKGRSLGFTKRIVKQPYKYTKPLKRVSINCVYCGKEIQVIPAIRDRKKYCNKICRINHQKITMRGENNPSYKNGSSYNKRCYRGNDWEKIRNEIYKRDHFTCKICGIKCVSKRDANKNNSSRIIQCHHIENYNINKNNSPENLITTCATCHGRLHNETQY